MQALILLARLLGLSVLNRLRGDASWKPQWLPGRALYYVTLILTVLHIPFYGWKVGVAVGGMYLLWGLWPWRRWYTLGQHPVEDKPDWYERIVEWMARRLPYGDAIGVYWALYIRHAWLIPGLILVAYATQWQAGLLPLLVIPIAPALFVLSTWIAMRLSWNYIWIAELLQGAVMGVVLVLILGM